MDNAITKNLIVAVAILSTGTHYKITTETYNQIHQAGLDDLINLPYVNKFANFKVSAVMDIVPIDDYKDYHPEKSKRNYHQPYSDLLKTTEKILTPEQRNKMLLKGLRKVRPEATMEEIVEFMKPKKKEILYGTYEEAKAAGVKF